VYPDGCGYFPDSVSERATSHVEALTRLVKKGIPCTVLFTLQRDDAVMLRPSVLHDPRFDAAMRRGVKAGLHARAIRLVPTLEGISFDGEVPVDVSGSDVQLTRSWSAAYDSTSGWVRKDGKWAGRRLPSP
jgi:sugar fermentation stimulation protein A